MHGLESLIEYYMENPGVLAEGLVLKEPVKGEQPPPDTRRHGHTNLLHRATSHGNYTIVKELLKTGYRHDTKNDEGQTAVHLASFNGKDDILRKLICHGASINTRDTAGYTPLHVRRIIFYVQLHFLLCFSSTLVKIIIPQQYDYWYKLVVQISKLGIQILVTYLYTTLQVAATKK